MPQSTTEPPWEFLVSASPFALQSYELSRLNHAANLRKEIACLLDQWIEESTCALLARWLIERREASPAHPESPSPSTPEASTRAPASDNFPAERHAAPGSR